jgi:D-galactarolactone cycloisomerase
MPLTIDAIEIHHYRFPLDPPSTPPGILRRSLTATLVRVRIGDFEGVGSGDTMLGFAGHEHLFLGQDPFAIERHVRVLDALQFHYGRSGRSKLPCGTSSARPPANPFGGCWAA